ncbi:MAG: aminodeoxychorismate lyase [Steroidobacteraceae bacterium]|nr:aminodeoxychorismate lyase [Steroidobacteraceae bacterium]
MSVATWVDGVPCAALPADDRGLLYGDGVFETLVCERGRPRFLAQHLARLAAGCEALGFASPPRALLEAELRIAAAGGDALLRLTVTRGSSPQRGYAPPPAPRPRRIVARYPWVAGTAGAPPAIRVADSPVLAGLAPQLAGLKHLNRLENVLARARLAGSGCDEAVVCDANGHVVGGTMSNLFVVLGGRLVTPAIATAGVRGVMRGVVLREAPGLGLEVQERMLRREELAGASEVFFTNVRIGLWPVAELGGQAFAPAPGAVTLALRARIAALRD